MCSPCRRLYFLYKHLHPGEQASYPKWQSFSFSFPSSSRSRALAMFFFGSFLHKSGDAATPVLLTWTLGHRSMSATRKTDPSTQSIMRQPSQPHVLDPSGLGHNMGLFPFLLFLTHQPRLMIHEHMHKSELPSFSSVVSTNALSVLRSPLWQNLISLLQGVHVHVHRILTKTVIGSQLQSVDIIAGLVTVNTL